MSLATWKEEYVGDVDRVAGDAIAATKHSIHKWMGLRPEALASHAVRKVGYGIAERSPDTDVLRLDFNTCALCKYSMDAVGEVNCDGCPYTTHFGCSCEDSPRSPYPTWYATDDPEPMIVALNVVLEELLKKQGDSNVN